MKHSRIFLGTTSALLAIAGVAAAKMSHFTTGLTRYYCTKDFEFDTCLPYTKVTCVSQTNGTKTCYFTAGAVNGHTVYTLYTNGSIQPPGSYLRCAGANCTTVVKYITLVQ